MVPHRAGSLKVIGCHVTLFGVTWLQRFVTSLRRVPRLPNVQVVEAEWGTEDNMFVELDVLPPMPLLRWQFLKIDSEQSWPSTLDDIPKLPATNQQEKEKILTVFVRAGEDLNFKLRLTNVSTLPVHHACVLLDQKMRLQQDSSSEYLTLKIDEESITEKLPLVPEAMIEVPVKVIVHQSVPANSITSKVIH